MNAAQQRFQQDILHQQAVMTVLGYYHGALDGVWGPKSQVAKAAWERSNKFVPAPPNGGMPFTDRGLLPFGVSRDANRFLQVEGSKKLLEAAQAPTKQPPKPAPPSLMAAAKHKVDTSVDEDAELKLQGSGADHTEEELTADGPKGPPSSEA